MSPLDTIVERVGRFTVGDRVRVKPVAGRRLPSNLRGEWRITALHEAPGMTAYADIGGGPQNATRSLTLDRLVKPRKQVTR